MTDFPKGIIGKVTDHPIMLAEKLVSSYAVPLFFNAVPKGVLLIGNRKAYYVYRNGTAACKRIRSSLGTDIKGADTMIDAGGY